MLNCSSSVYKSDVHRLRARVTGWREVRSKGIELPSGWESSGMGEKVFLNLLSSSKTCKFQ